MILLISLIVPLLFSSIYSFIPQLSFSIARHFVLPAISLVILFFTFDVTFSFTSFFHVDFFLHVFLSISISKVSVIFVDFCRNCCYNSFFFLLYHLLDVFFLHCCSLSFDIKSKLRIVFCSASRIPDSLNIPVYDVLTVSLNIFFKAFACVLSVSFIFSFYLYPYASIPYITVGIKQASKSFNCTLISSFPT